MSPKNTASAKKRIMLNLHKGGTIGMNISPETKMLVPPADDTAYQAAMKPVTDNFLAQHDNIELLYECLSVFDSNNLNAEITEEETAYIRAREHEVDAIGETLGTDGQAAELAKLKLAFLDHENPNRRPDLVTPVTVTGAQSSIYSKPQDAEGNVTNLLHLGEEASRINYYPDIRQVFGSAIHNAAYVMKIHERNNDAFGVVNIEGLLGSCANSGISLNHMFYSTSLVVSAAQRKAILDFRVANGITPLKSGRFMVCPLATKQKTIIVNGVSKTVTETAPLQQGGYIHKVSASTLGDPRSILLQARDPNCLGIIFELTGIGNAPESYLDAIREAVSQYDLPVYGTLAISGGQASTAEYEAGALFHEAGVAVGFDAGPAFTEAKLTWLLANEGGGLTAKALMKKARLPWHESWLPNRHKALDMPELPNAYGMAEGDNTFAERRANAISLVEAYRRFKGENLRWIRVKDPKLAKRVAALLPKAREDLILPHHQNLDFATLLGWAPPVVVEQQPKPLSLVANAAAASRPIVLSMASAKMDVKPVSNAEMQAIIQLESMRKASLEFEIQLSPKQEADILAVENRKYEAGYYDLYGDLMSEETLRDEEIEKHRRRLLVVKNDPALAAIASTPFARIADMVSYCPDFFKAYIFYEKNREEAPLEAALNLLKAFNKGKRQLRLVEERERRLERQERQHPTYSC